MHQLLQDLAILVQLQGELIDNIEKNLLEAKDHVEKGEGYIEDAKKNMEAARKVFILIMILP